MFASSEGHTEVVKVLADSKADPNVTDEVNCMTNYLLTLADYSYRCVRIMTFVSCLFHYRKVSLLSS